MTMMEAFVKKAKDNFFFIDQFFDKLLLYLKSLYKKCANRTTRLPENGCIVVVKN